MSREFKWRIGLSVSLIASLLLCLTFAFWPENQAKAEIVWKPKSGDDAGALVLSRGWPSALTFSASCSDFRSVRPVETFNAGGLVLGGDGNGRVTLRTATPQGFSISQFPPERHVQVSMTLPEGRCELSGGFRAQEKRIWLRVQGRYVEKAVPREAFPPITQLRSERAGKPVVDRVEIITRPTGIESSPERTILGALAFLVLGLAVFLSVFRDGGSSINPWPRSISLRNPFPLPDLGVALLFVGAAFLLPSFPDDGWVWMRTEAAGQTGVFSNLFTAEDAWFFQGFLNEAILGALVDIGASFLDLRILMALLLTASWIALRIWVLEPLVGMSSRIIWPAAMAFTAFASVYLVTLRAEPWVVLCVCACWVALAAFIRRPSQAALFFGLAFGALALSIHQSGWVALGPSLVLVWLAYEGVRGGQLSLFATLRTAVLAALFGLTTVALPFSIPTAFESIKDFSSSPDSFHNNTLSELLRYVELLSLASFPRLFAAVSFVVVFLFFFFYLLSTAKRQTDRLLLFAIAISFGALFLTTSKWAWHFGVLAPAFALLLSIILSVFFRSKETPRVSSGPAILLIGLVVCVMFASSTEMGFGSHDFAERSWERLALKIGPGEQTELWVLLLILTAAIPIVGRRLSTQRWQLLIAGGISIVLISPVVVSLAWIALDSVKSDQWTLAKQNLTESTNGTDCGTLSDTRLFSGAPKPLKRVRKGSSGFPAYGHPGKAGIRALGPVRGPLPGVAAWDGSQALVVPRRDSRGEEQTHQAVSPLFDSDGIDSITLWTWSGNSYNPPARRVVALSSEGAILSQRALKVPPSITWKGFNPDTWFIHEMRVPPKARFVFITATDAASLRDSNTLVSSPVVTAVNDSKQVLESGRAFVGPFERLHVPCVTTVIPKYGYWPKIKFLIRDEGSELLLPVDQDTVTRTSIGCSRYGRTCVERLGYQQAVVRRAERDRSRRVR